VSKYEGTGPGGGWDIKGMADEIHRLNLCLDHDNQRIMALEQKLEDLALIAPGRSTTYLPRNRRT
jgi:hypothetical protein